MLSNGTNGGEITNALENLSELVDDIVLWAFIAALVFSVVSFCASGWALVPILTTYSAGGAAAGIVGASISCLWSAIAVASAADGLGDAIEGNVTGLTKARVASTTLGKTVWKLIWKWVL